MTGKWTFTVLFAFLPFLSCIYTSSVAGKLSKLFLFKLIRPIQLRKTMSQWKRSHHLPSPSRHRERSHTTSGGPPKRRKIPDSVPLAAESSLGFNLLYVTANSKRHGEDQWPGFRFERPSEILPPLNDDQFRFWPIPIRSLIILKNVYRWLLSPKLRRLSQNTMLLSHQTRKDFGNPKRYWIPS